jgi:GNAT superfamily N-acetyltransferase
MQVRKATRADSERLLKLIEQLQQHIEHANPNLWRLSTAGRHKLTQDIKDMLSDPQGRFLVAEYDTHLVGFVYGLIIHRLEYEPNKIGMISRLFVQPVHRRRGVATQLIRELCNYFHAEGVRHISLRYVEGNREAEHFWQHVGFIPIIYTAFTDIDNLQQHLK